MTKEKQEYGYLRVGGTTYKLPIEAAKTLSKEKKKLGEFMAKKKKKQVYTCKGVKGIQKKKVKGKKCSVLKRKKK